MNKMHGQGSRWTLHSRSAARSYKSASRVTHSGLLTEQSRDFYNERKNRYTDDTDDTEDASVEKKYDRLAFKILQRMTTVGGTGKVLFVIFTNICKTFLMLLFIVLMSMFVSNTFRSSIILWFKKRGTQDFDQQRKNINHEKNGAFFQKIITLISNLPFISEFKDLVEWMNEFLKTWSSTAYNYSMVAIVGFNIFYAYQFYDYMKSNKKGYFDTFSYLIGLLVLILVDCFTYICFEFDIIQHGMWLMFGAIFFGMITNACLRRICRNSIDDLMNDQEQKGDMFAEIEVPNDEKEAFQQTFQRIDEFKNHLCRTPIFGKNNLTPGRTRYYVKMERGPVQNSEVGGLELVDSTYMSSILDLFLNIFKIIYEILRYLSFDFRKMILNRVSEVVTQVTEEDIDENYTHKQHYPYGNNRSGPGYH